MHEFGNYLGTIEFAAMPVEVDEELIGEVINLQAQIEAMNKNDYRKG